ncbi:MAG: efflux RND transporter permease subunit [Nitrospinota bacterium]
MKALARFSVRNRVIINLLTIFVIGAGILTYWSMHREIFPEFSRQAIRINTEYLGASPEEVEKLITAKVEEELSDLDGLDELFSISHEGLSEILLKFRPGTEMNRALDDVRAALDNVTDLPQEAEKPKVQEVKYSWPVITVSLAADIDEDVLRRMARNLKDDFRRIPGVAAVTILGDRERQIWVEVEPARLEEYSLTLDGIRTAIAAHNRNVPGGTLKTPRGEILIRSLGEAQGAEDVKRIIVRSLPTGTSLRVGDLARVRETFEDPVTLARWGGKPAINLVVVKEREGDSINIARAVREQVDEIRPQLPETVQIGVNNDLSVFIRNRLNTLRTSGFIGLTIVLILLCLFLRFRVAILTGLGIPFAMLGGIALMATFGMSLNMLSLFALILVLGLLVDDAIVVSENIYRHVEAGMDPRKAAVEGTAQVAWPVVATVITTVAAFLPLLMVPGEMGIFLSPIPLVVSFALLASLLEALLILPSHIADVITPAYAKGVRHRETRLLNRMRKAYRGLLEWALRWRYVSAGLLLSITIVLAALAFYRVPFVVFREFESSLFFVNMETSPGSKIGDTLEVAKQAERVALKLPPGELKSLSTNVGVKVLDVVRLERGPNLAQLVVELEEKGRKRSVDEIIAGLREGMEKIPGILKVQFLKTQAGPGGPPIEVRIAGESLPVLRGLADEAKNFLSGIQGVRDIRDDFTEGKEELQITLRPEARALGLSLREIAVQVQQGFQGVEASTIQRRDEDVPIVVRFPEEHRLRTESLDNLKITLASGEQVFLKDVAHLETGIGISKVRRYNQKRTITVFSDVNPRQANALQVSERLRKKFHDVGRRFPGHQILIRGERQEAEASLASLPRISVIALLLIYFILGSLFRSFIQPLVVMGAIPLALDGVVLGHLIMGETLSFLSAMGLVALIGVVVNDSLIMVDFINRARRGGAPRDEAIVESGIARLRPILLTTATTVGGLTPLAFFASGQAKFLSPMAISVVWGLSFATILTLILIPCLYAIMDDVVGLLRRLVGLKPLPADPGAEYPFPSDQPGVMEVDVESAPRAREPSP